MKLFVNRLSLTPLRLVAVSRAVLSRKAGAAVIYMKYFFFLRFHDNYYQHLEKPDFIGQAPVTIK